MASLCKSDYPVKVKVISHPGTQELDLAKVLQALSDPVRLMLVCMLAAEKDLSCNALCLGRPKSSMSHHFKIMIEAGLLRVDIVGNTHRNNLRLNDLESRFPGLMLSVLRAGETINQRQVKSRKFPKKNGAQLNEVANA